MAKEVWLGKRMNTHMEDRYFTEMVQFIREEILYDYETYETIPVISRYRTLEKGLKECDGISRSRILLSLAILILNIAREMCNDRKFFAISFNVNDFYEEGFISPNIVVSGNAEYIRYYMNTKSLEIKDNNLNMILEHIIGTAVFSIHGSLEEEIILIPKIFINRDW
ncbi:MAG: Imm15 family immunity protein [Bacteroidales bacterium]|nr:Imm15 family immunity protein [Bacteroidales bacterium]